MSDTAVKTLDSVSSNARYDKAAGGPIDALAPIVIRDVPGQGPRLFTGPLQPEGQVSFGAAAGPFKVWFPKGSPLLGLPNPFTVAAGPSITATVAGGLHGTFRFDMVALDGTFAFSDLALEVAETLGNGEVYRAGVEVDAGGGATLQVFVKPGDATVNACFVNQTSTAEVLLTKQFSCPPRTVQVAAGEVKIDPFDCAALGAVMHVAFETQAAEGSGTPAYEDQTGGIQQADIIVEPPP